MEISFFKSIPTRQEVGILMYHESYMQSKVNMEHLMKNHHLSDLKLKPTIKMDEAKNGDGVYGFELSYMLDTHSDEVMRMIGLNDLPVYRIPMYKDEVLKVIHKPKEQSELWFAGEFVERGDKKFINRLAYQFEQFYEIEVQRENVLDPSIIKLTSNIRIDKEIDPVAWTPVFVDGVSQLIKKLENEGLTDNEFYYTTEEGGYKFYTSLQVKKLFNDV